MLVTWLGCSGSLPDSVTSPTGDTGPEVVLLEDVGRACLYGDASDGEATETTFTAEAPTVVRVVLEECASACATEVTATCTAYPVSTEIAVIASGSYTLPAGQVTCPPSCVEVVATCEGPPLSAGSWAVHYANGHSDAFTVPGAGAVPCASPP